MSHTHFEFHMGNSPKRIYGNVYDFGAFGNDKGYYNLPRERTFMGKG